MTESLGHSLLAYLDKLTGSNLSEGQQLNIFKKLFHYLIVTLSDQSNIQFTSSFARVNFLIGFYQIVGREAYTLYLARKIKDGAGVTTQPTLHLKLYKRSVDVILTKMLNSPERFQIADVELKSFFDKNRTVEVQSFVREVQVFLTEIDRNEGILLGKLTKEPFDNIQIVYGRTDRNDDFTKIIHQIQDLGLVPIHCNLIDVEVDNDGIYHPSAFVFEPDQLYDVTAISECFGAFATHELGYILRKFDIKGVSLPIMIGNMANHFLDQLIFKPELEFKEVQSSLFGLYPLELSQLDDLQLRDLLQSLSNHFTNIKESVTKQLADLKITKEVSYVEPSFYSAKYGIQGRLDLFAKSDDHLSIVELKSGKPFKANNYGINNNHYHQTLLYDMIVESVYGRKIKRNNFILYSSQPDNQLRYAPAIRSEQRETIRARNRLLIHDRSLADADDFVVYIKDLVKANKGHIKGYQKKDLDLLLGNFQKLTPVERAYCNTMMRFVLQEFVIAKLGNDSSERSTGLSALWRDGVEQKKEHFNILNHLTIRENNAEESDPILILYKTEHTAELSNFRTGDLGILYPYNFKKESALQHQVFKCTILNQTKDTVEIRLRSKQENAGIFRRHEFWNIEHDHLDGSFNAMSKSIYEFAVADDQYRYRVIGSVPPVEYEIQELDRPDQLTDEQFDLYKKIISAKDYFLLWGPPGTGKTSIMLKSVVTYFINQTDKTVLLLAYTNRAVDEICRAIESIDKDISYMRVGSRFSTHPDFREQLLTNRCAQFKTRAGLKEFVLDQNLVVGTVASVTSKKSLFNMINFDVALVDEASQILEPSLAGLLSRVPKFVLIGDHVQLPAVVQQKRLNCHIMNEDLKELGFKNIADSMFERLYHQVTNQNWHHAYGQLTHQGRMHQQLMDFVNDHFYNDKLNILPSIQRLQADIPFVEWSGNHNPLFSSRIIYIPTEVEVDGNSMKVNKMEADVCAKILQAYIHLYDNKGSINFTASTIGVITPYRAQIAQINKRIEELDLINTDKISVDTVERYQGGARDIIILSTAVNLAFQLDSIVSLSDKKEDRKLNVAFTRAREQFILVGNEGILSQNEVYKDLINRAYRINPNELGRLS